MDKAIEQIKITEEILDLMSKDYYFPIVLFIILITVICMFLGILILLLDKKFEVFVIGILGTCFLLYHISTFNEKDPNKFFEYQRKDNGVLEIQSNNLLLKNKAESKIIEDNDKITLKDINTNKESKPLDKEAFFKTIKLNN
jgi:hypothetical protein